MPWKFSNSAARSASPATTRLFCRRTRNSKLLTRFNTMKGGFDVAGGNCLSVCHVQALLPTNQLYLVYL